MRSTQRKLQATATINMALPLIKKDGSQATGLALNTLSTKIIKPDGTALAGYTEATFTEPNSDGVYNIQFPAGAATPAFTLADQSNPYTVTVDSSTADVEPTTLEVWIVSRLPHELALETSVARLLGLSLENAVEDTFVFDTNGMPVSSIIYCYDSAANATAHDGVTGLVAKYNVTATHTSKLPTLMKVIKQ